VHHADPQCAEGERVSVLHREVDERRGARAVHHHRRAELARDVARRGEVIGVRVRVDQVLDRESARGRGGRVALGAVEDRIDDRRHAILFAADEVRATAFRGEFLEDHGPVLAQAVYDAR
jgi:hypothetical protein